MRLFLFGCLMSLAPVIAMANEAAHNAAFCARIGGTTEVRHPYTYPGGNSYVLVDCETADTVYEGGLDKRSSLDSVQQAFFFAYATGKEPGIVIYDTDGQIGKYEYRIQIACDLAGVQYIRQPVTLRTLPEGQVGPPEPMIDESVLRHIGP